MNQREKERFRWHAASRIYAGYIAAGGEAYIDDKELLMSLAIRDTDKIIAKLERTAHKTCEHKRQSHDGDEILRCMDCDATL